MKTNPPAYGDETRHKLLQAATEVFIEQGFQAARVQSIAQAAGVRLSAINYHFGNKEGLYLAVLRHHADLAISQQPLMPASGSNDLKSQFRFMIHSLLLRMLDDRQNSQMARLVLREMVNPTAAIDDLFEQIQQPQLQQILLFLKTCLPAANPQQLLRTALSILGQCVIYALARPVIDRLDTNLMAATDWLEKTEEHIVTFSWAGINALQENSTHEQ